MYLYHGSNVEVNAVDYNECSDISDFGKGFYTTNNKEQAITWAKRMAIEHMNSEYNPDIKAIVTIFNFDTSIFKDAKVKCMRFRGASIPWALFVKNNIQSNVRCKNMPKGENNLDLKYDLVSGYLATPDLAILFSNYENGVIDKAIFKICLNSMKKTNQYSFHTWRSAKYLKSPVHEYFHVTKEEFDNFHISKNYCEVMFFVFKENNYLCHRKVVVNMADMVPLKDE